MADQTKPTVDIDAPAPPGLLQDRLREAKASFAGTKPALTGSRIKGALRIQELQQELSFSKKFWIRSVT